MCKFENLLDSQLNVLIEKYIDGDDIDDFELDYLESNYVFMTRVIMQTNDKKMYDLCSDELKGNFKFVEFLIKKFHDDKMFVDNVILNFYCFCDESDRKKYDYINYFKDVISDKNKLIPHFDYFIENCENQALVLELLSQLSKDRDAFLDYAIKFNVQIVAWMADAHISVEKIDDPKVKKILGMGFVILRDEFCESELVVNEFATRYIRDIFYNEHFDIEKFLHESFTSKEAIIEYGLNRFISDYLESQDHFLAEYVLIRPHLIKDVLKDFNKALDNWDNFNLKNSDNRIGIIFDKAKDYLHYNQSDIMISDTEMVYYVAHLMGLTDLFDDYIIRNYYSDEDEEVYEPVDISDIIGHESSFTFAELKYLQYLKDLFKELFSQRVVQDDLGEYNPERDVPGQIIIFSKN